MFEDQYPKAVAKAVAPSEPARADYHAMLTAERVRLAGVKPKQRLEWQLYISEFGRNGTAVQHVPPAITARA